MEKTIDSNSGLLSEGGGRKEYFIVGTEPKLLILRKCKNVDIMFTRVTTTFKMAELEKPKMQFLQRNQKNYY